ncbi:MAG: hypothetical protein IVW54_06390 [Candidatus Binataceae bacterium]|nr:hypothetical protein [Candidatus Binataceae bacterium]
MKIRNKLIWLIFSLVNICVVMMPWQASAQFAGGLTAQQLWVDPASGQVFIRPGHGRVPLHFEGASSRTAIDQQVAKKVDERVHQSEMQMQASTTQLQTSNLQLQQQVADLQQGWKGYMSNFGNKIKVGTLLYGDYSLYTHTGFGPQFLTQTNPPGPGNNMFNSFDITRTYLNLLFFPTDDWLFRFTPNLYRTIGSSNQKFGTNESLGTSLNGNLGLRVKYAFLRYNKGFDWWQPAKSDTITVGQQPNPLVDWEEQFFRYRFVALTPWNYLSLSSSQAGISAQGPITIGEKQYLDYDVGVFNNASFHAFEGTNTKEAMARLSYWPFGANWRFDGLGLTGFFNYGYGNTTPDAAQIPTAFKGPNSAIYRMAAMIHYSTEQMGIMFEYDLGKNSFSSGNFFSGSGPPQQFGTTPAPPKFGAFNTMTNGILNTGSSQQQGFDVLGRYHIPYTPFDLFGLYEWFMPNTKISKDPLDFQRWVVGVGYQYNEFLRFALDSQNLLFYHKQFTFPAGEVSGVGATPFAVPGDTHVFMLNVEFNY